MINAGENKQSRAGRYVQQPAGYRAFIPAPLPPAAADREVLNSSFEFYKAILVGRSAREELRESVITTKRGETCKPRKRGIERLGARPAPTLITPLLTRRACP